LELKQYIRLARKWLWLIVISAFIGGGIAFISAVRQVPVYQASATVAIGTFIQSPNPDYAQIAIGFDLVETYAQLVKTTAVLSGTVNALNLDIPPRALLPRISTRIITGTTLLVITVTYPDPVLAADIANTLAEQLIANSPTNLTPEQQEQIVFLNAQIDDLNTQIQDARDQLRVIAEELNTAADQATIDRLISQRTAIIDQINLAQSNIARFTATIADLQQRTNALDIVERAEIPTGASGSRPESSALLGAFIGVVLAFGAALVIEYLDDTIQTTEQAAELLKLPVLAAIIRFGKKNSSYPDRLITRFPSMSAIAEGYRTARTNMLFSSNGQNGRKETFIITSANPQEGKTITASNLAIVMAQAGLQVLLIDADLRRPKIHEVFGLENSVGLTTLLFSDPAQVPAEAIPQVGDNAGLPPSFAECVQYTAIPRLRVITSGFIPSNPTEVLGSTVMGRWIDLMRLSPAIDVIILDTAPVLAAADSAVLAATTGAATVLVIDAGSTRRGAALRAKEQFDKLGLALKGVIVNRVDPRDDEYGYYYKYYYTSRPNQPVKRRSEKQNA
jgi:non-specific protein-tyrosine kinase